MRSRQEREEAKILMEEKRVSRSALVFLGTPNSQFVIFVFTMIYV